MKLTIEIVPKPCWYKNVRSEVTSAEWDVIKNKCYNQAGRKCEICGGSGRTQGYSHDVECHEIWHYDDEKHIQRLDGFIALCPMCHKVKHIGLSSQNGEYEMCVKHLRTVNKWSRRRENKYLDEVQQQFLERSKHIWTIDLSYVEEYLKKDELAELMSRFVKK